MFVLMTDGLFVTHILSVNAINIWQWSATCRPNVAPTGVSCGLQTDSKIVHNVARARNLNIYNFVVTAYTATRLYH